MVWDSQLGSEEALPAQHRLHLLQSRHAPACPFPTPKAPLGFTIAFAFTPHHCNECLLCSHFTTRCKFGETLLQVNNLHWMSHGMTLLLLGCCLHVELALAPCPGLIPAPHCFWLPPGGMGESTGMVKVTKFVVGGFQPCMEIISCNGSVVGMETVQPGWGVLM